MWFLSAWPPGDGDRSVPHCWLVSGEEARQDPALAGLGRGAQSWNVCSQTDECLTLVSMRREGPTGASTWCLTFRKAGARGQLLNLCWLMPVFWLLMSFPCWVPPQLTCLLA